MYEDAQKIFDYLPIRPALLEGEYIQYLWETFSILDNTETSTRSFSIMPFHLLFMMAIQYKVLRIYKTQQDKYNLAMIIKHPRNGEEGVLYPESPSTLAFLGEAELIDLLKIVGLSKEDAKGIKKLTTNYRNNNLAHAKGYIEPNIISKIKDYLDSLDKIQSVYLYMNIDIANRILDEIKEYEYLDMDVIFERNMLDDNITPKDLGVIISCILNSEEEFIFFEQLEYLVNKGLEFSYQDTISALKIRVLDEFDDDKRLYLIRTLVENNEIDESLKKKILIRSVKRDYEKEIIELLNT